MIAIVCVDKEFGMMFHHRRQSQDRFLREHIIKEVAGRPLWMNAYSGKQFSEYADKIIIAEDCLAQAGDNEYCFMENMDVKPYIGKVEQVILYRWNRKYPADLYFTISLTMPEWRQVEKEDFKGSSHEKITKEVYIHEKIL